MQNKQEAIFQLAKDLLICKINKQPAMPEKEIIVHDFKSIVHLANKLMDLFEKECK